MMALRQVRSLFHGYDPEPYRWQAGAQGKCNLVMQVHDAHSFDATPTWNLPGKRGDKGTEKAVSECRIAA